LKEAFERRVDHIVFMVDMTSKLSLQRVAESVAYVDCDFSLARASVVVINSDTPARFSFAIDEVLNFCDLYGTFIHYCTLEDADSLVSVSFFTGFYRFGDKNEKLENCCYWIFFVHNSRLVY